MPSERRLITSHLGVFKQKLAKLVDKIKAEKKKPRSERSGEFLKKTLEEAKGLRNLVKQMEEQMDGEGGNKNKRKALFVKKEFKMHSGGTAEYKIECDALTDEDLETLAFIISRKGAFSDVYGVPRGGVRLQKALEKYKQKDGVKLIVDDVLTTGASMEEAKQKKGWSDAVGIVIFARGSCPDWVKPLFHMLWMNTKDKF